MIIDRLIALVRCPECRGTIARSADSGDVLTCQACGRAYRAAGGGYLDMRPRISSQSRPNTWTKRCTPIRDTSPCRRRSSARRFATTCCASFSRPRRRSCHRPGLRQRASACLEPRSRRRHDRDRHQPVLRRRGATRLHLLLGDLRRLPFADGTFTKAWSLDVLEHLSPDALQGMLGEANRVLAPGGALFVYTHVRKNARVADGPRWSTVSRTGSSGSG